MVLSRRTQVLEFIGLMVLTVVDSHEIQQTSKMPYSWLMSQMALMHFMLLFLHLDYFNLGHLVELFLLLCNRLWIVL